MADIQAVFLDSALPVCGAILSERGITMGSFSENSYLSSEPYKAAYLACFGAVEPIYSMGVNWIHRRSSVFDFEYAENLIDLASREGLKIFSGPLIDCAEDGYFTTRAHESTHMPAYCSGIVSSHIATVMDYFHKITDWIVIQDLYTPGGEIASPLVHSSVGEYKTIQYYLDFAARHAPGKTLWIAEKDGRPELRRKIVRLSKLKNLGGISIRVNYSRLVFDCLFGGTKEIGKLIREIKQAGLKIRVSVFPGNPGTMVFTDKDLDLLKVKLSELAEIILEEKPDYLFLYSPEIRDISSDLVKQIADKDIKIYHSFIRALIGRSS